MEKPPKGWKSSVCRTPKSSASSTGTPATGSAEKVFKRPAAFVRPTAQSRMIAKPRASPLNSSAAIKSPMEARKQSGATSTSTSRRDEVAICVAVRMRPMLSNEFDVITDPTVSINVDSCLGTICLSRDNQERIFQFDHCIRDVITDGQTADDRQVDIFNKLGAPMVSDVVKGINCTLFAYGQTGTGKTYSLFGTANELGLIPRTCERLLGVLRCMDPETQWNMEVSFLEMYNEKLRDLLISEEKSCPLKIRDYPDDGVFVQGLSVVPVERFCDIQTLIEIGCGRRITACTINNNYSSRSHAVFIVKVKIHKKINTGGNTYRIHTIKSSLNMVDLAGSERLSTLSRLKETTSINKSLSCLAMVIDQLSESARFISHRDSALTWLLKESLGGNAKTTILATVSPARRSISETFRTLRYADRAKKMTNRVRINEDKSTKLLEQLVEQLASRDRMLLENQEEIERLRLRLSMGSSAVSSDANRTSVVDVQLQYDHEAKKSGKNMSFSSIQAPSEPFVVLLSPDPQISGGLLFSLRVGANHIGTDRNCDILVHGTRIASLHCTLSLTEQSRATLVPTKDNDTFVNGALAEDVRELFDGDRLCLAGEQYFMLYLNTPQRCNMEGLFDKAQVEYLHAQNQRLLNKLESMPTVKEVTTESVAVGTRIHKRSVGTQGLVEKSVSTPKRRSADTQTAQQKAFVAICAEDIGTYGSVVAVDFMVREANSIMESSNDPFRFTLCDKAEVTEGEPLRLTVKMTNLSMDISVTMSAADFQDHWAVLLSLHQCGKRKRFSDYLSSVFFGPDNEEGGPQRRVSNLFPFAMNALKESSRRTSLASFDGKLPSDLEMIKTPTDFKALSYQAAYVCEGFASVSDIQCDASKMPVDWFLLSARNLECLLARFRANPADYMVPVIFGLQHMHVCYVMYVRYPNRLPGVAPSLQLLESAMKRLCNAVLSIFKVSNDGAPVRPEPQDMLSVILGEVIEAAASLSFVMPSVAGSHTLTEACEWCNLSPHLMEALLRGAYYGYKQLRIIICTLLDQKISDNFNSKLNVEAVMLGLESLKPIAKSCKAAMGDLRAACFTAFCLLRPLMHSLCAAAGFDDVSYKPETVQDVKSFVDALNGCPAVVDREALRTALLAVYPYLPDLHSFENNVILSSQRKERTD
uniref:Kinesin-like protein unc-104 n=1 Tax=Trichuris muris TaxID=70415 RepID=A0A5S6QZ13_TRIMR